MIEQIAGLALLRVPFPDHQISKLPKPTKKQTDDVKADFKSGIRCKICGGWHHKDVVHLDYVGHAALTDRLLNADPLWSWEPVSFGADGLPVTDKNGGLWIRLTVCGRSMLGYGHPDGKSGGDAVKEAIGDALRNAAMRMGAALDLWHKGDLHADDQQAPSGNDDADAMWTNALNAVKTAVDMPSLQKHFIAAQSLISNEVEKNQLVLAKDVRKSHATLCPIITGRIAVLPELFTMRPISA